MFVTFYRRCVILYDVIVFFISTILVYIRLFYRLFIPRELCSIEGEVALITGAGNGIGRHLALQLAQLGVVVICLDVDQEKNDETVSMVKKLGKTAIGYKCDVSNREQVDEVALQILNEVGDVTIIFNNAGVRRVRPFIQYTPKQIERMINVNLFGQLWILRAFLPRLIKNDRGTIVSMSALAGYGGFPNMLPFVASKFAVRGLMESLYLELRQEHPDHKIHLMTVAPFVVDTGVVQGSIIRFPGLVNVVSAESAATTIINNMRRKETVVFIPGIYYYIQNMIRILPLKVQLLLTDFIDTGIEIHYDNHDD